MPTQHEHSNFLRTSPWAMSSPHLPINGEWDILRQRTDWPHYCSNYTPQGSLRPPDDCRLPTQSVLHLRGPFRACCALPDALSRSF